MAKLGSGRLDALCKDLATGFRLLAAAAGLGALSACGGPQPEAWHEIRLDSEFTTDAEVSSFDEYLALEQSLFDELDERIYAGSPTGPKQALQRYSRGSLADPGERRPDWNRSFELAPEQASGGILLLHGMSDSPYSLRALGESFRNRGYHVVGLRLPGHGTAPSGMLGIHWTDMAAATDLAWAHLSKVAGGAAHIIGYSTGAALALDLALRAEQNPALGSPSSLVLISPAVGISPAAGLAKWKRRLGILPGLGGMAWLQIEPEFDPYKYNSFATNAAEQVHGLTSSVASRLASRDSGSVLPPILILKSTVDATVSTDAVVDRLLSRLAPNRHELVLFDINRYAANTALLVNDPGPFTRRLVDDHQLPFGLTLVTNRNGGSREVEALYKAPFTAGASRREPLVEPWPRGVFSLSHVALPFPPDDPLYGRERPDEPVLFLGQQALQGERGLLRISSDYLLRLRHNPFFSYLERRVDDWIEVNNGR
jgi:alpha-beta hydrolase superfamily lysophospholipase